MLAVASLGAHIQDKDVPRLIALTDSKYDQSTRGCATHLLGCTLSPDAFFKVYELIKDADAHVSKIASMVMLRKGIAEVLPQILNIWDNPETLNRDREEIVLGMPPAIAINNLRIFKESVCNKGISNEARSWAIKLLGDVSTGEALPDMKTCLEKETEGSIREALEAAIALIEKRQKEGISVMPVEIPAGMNLVFQPKPAVPSDNATENVPAPVPEKNN